MTAIVSDEASVAIEGGGVELRRAEIGGGMTVAFVSVPGWIDFGPALQGLPGGSCPCPHWGYLFTGRLRVRSANGEQTYVAGQAFHRMPGHVPETVEDCRWVEFSPTEE